MADTNAGAKTRTPSIRERIQGAAESLPPLMTSAATGQTAKPVGVELPGQGPL